MRSCCCHSNLLVCSRCFTTWYAYYVIPHFVCEVFVNLSPSFDELLSPMTKAIWHRPQIHSLLQLIGVTEFSKPSRNRCPSCHLCEQTLQHLICAFFLLLVFTYSCFAIFVRQPLTKTSKYVPVAIMNTGSHVTCWSWSADQVPQMYSHS